MNLGRQAKQCARRQLIGNERALDAATAKEAIERAFDLALCQRELVDGTRAKLGIEITPPDIEP